MLQWQQGGTGHARAELAGRPVDTGVAGHAAKVVFAALRRDCMLHWQVRAVVLIGERLIGARPDWKRRMEAGVIPGRAGL